MRVGWVSLFNCPLSPADNPALLKGEYYQDIASMKLSIHLFTVPYNARCNKHSLPPSLAHSAVQLDHGFNSPWLCPHLKTTQNKNKPLPPPPPHSPCSKNKSSCGYQIIQSCTQNSHYSMLFCKQPNSDPLPVLSRDLCYCALHGSPHFPCSAHPCWRLCHSLTHCAL